jgi:hypothetical protein
MQRAGLAASSGISGPPGFLEQSRDFLLGSKSAAGLRENQEKTFPLVERSRSQLVALQEALGAMLADFQMGIMPQVMKQTEEGFVETDMPTMQFLEKATALAGDQIAALERITSVMNKVATGGTNILTAALMGSNALQFAAARKDRASVKTSRRVGVDAIPPGVIDV